MIMYNTIKWYKLGVRLRYFNSSQDTGKKGNLAFVKNELLLSTARVIWFKSLGTF